MVQGPRSSLNASAAKFDECRTAFSSSLTGTDQGPSMPFVQAACSDPFLQERAHSQANVTTMPLASVKEFRARCGHVPAGLTTAAGERAAVSLFAKGAFVHSFAPLRACGRHAQTATTGKN